MVVPFEGVSVWFCLVIMYVISMLTSTSYKVANRTM